MQAEFAFNSMENKSTRIPFSIVYCCLPKYALDLVPLPKLPGMSIAIENMADIIHAIQEEVRNQLEAYVAKYKEAAYKKRQEKIFNEGDLVMVLTRSSRRLMIMLMLLIFQLTWLFLLHSMWLTCLSTSLLTNLFIKNITRG
jgi:hypothetical protein